MRYFKLVIALILLTGSWAQGQIQTGGLNETTGAVITTVGGGLMLGGANVQTGSTYTFLITDENKLTVFDSGSAVAAALPTASTTGFGTGAAFYVFNEGAGTVTITPGTPSTINGGTTLALTQNEGAMIVGNASLNFLAWVSQAGAGTTVTIASGTSTMGTSLISSGACATAVTTTASGVATTDAIIIAVNADPTSTTGYAPSASGSLYIWSYPTSGNVNFRVCNNTAGSITPSAITINWRVVR